jgi:hypothetical protein
MDIDQLNHKKIQKRLLTAKVTTNHIHGAGFSSTVSVTTSGLTSEEEEYLLDVFLSASRVDGKVLINIVDNAGKIILFDNEDHATESGFLLAKCLQKKYMYHGFQKHNLVLSIQSSIIKISNISK